MENAEKIIQEALAGCSDMVKNIFDQPDMPEKDKLLMSFELILEKTSQLEIPSKLQAMLLSTILMSVVEPYILQQKCSRCQRSKTEINISKQEDKGLEGMFV